MSLDLFEPKTNSFVEGLPRTDSPPPGVFDNFLYGTGMAAMRGFAKTGRAIDLLGSVGPIVQDKIAGNTEASDKYFKEHEEVFQKAVDYWTPKPNEVGIAGEVVGNLVSMLPQVMASPGMAVGSTLLDAAEDLTKAGVSSPKAISVGVTQALGLGAGIWLPILGQTAAQRILLGGAGFNVVQGVATRGISGEILEGTPAEHQYKAFDPTSLTLDVLLGAAFGTMAHLNPAQREQGAEVLGKIKAWAEGLKPSEIDALATLREAEHLNKDSMPGVPKSMEDIDAHVQSMREGLDQIIRDQPVELSNMPKAQFDTDPERVAQAVDQARFLSEEAVKLRDEYGFADPEHITSQARSIGESVTETETPLAKTSPPPPPGEVQPAGASAISGESNAVQIEGANESSVQRGAGAGNESPRTDMARRNSEAEGAAGKGQTQEKTILAKTAERLATERGEETITIGQDAEGNPVKQTVKQFLDGARAEVDQAKEDVSLFEMAASCLLKSL